jgi:septal ring factor EnvC (AmiA/AmiB activator)
MRSVYIGMIVMLLALPGIARGQDEVKPEQWQKLYKDTLTQLKAAQNRKAELSAQVADLQKQLQTVNTQNDQLKRQVADFADRTFYLRTYYSAWLQFLATRPQLKVDWDLFLNAAVPLTPETQPPFVDPEWPLSDKG